MLRTQRLLLFCFLILLFSWNANASPPSSWHLGLRSTGYVYQQEDQAGQSNDHYQGFHVLSGSASGWRDGRFAVRGAGRLANDLHLNPYGFESSRLYNGYLEARLARNVRTRFGRQLVLGGSQSLVLDGAWVSWKPTSKSDLALWGGARSPYGRAFEVGSFEDDSALGARYALQWSRNWRSAISLAFNERDDKMSQQPLAVEVRGTPRQNLRTFARVIYDLENEQWSRLQAQVRWRPTAPVSASLQVLDRSPLIEPGSYFYRFADVNRIQVVRGSLRYEKESGFGAEADLFASKVDDRSASRLGAALLLPGGRAGYSARLGDAGEENRWYGEYGTQVASWLRIEGSATFQTYALFSDAPETDERELTTFAARMRAQLRPGLRLLAEIQSLDNPLYSEDIRFLCGIDLNRSGGASRGGFGTGGWLK